MYYFVIGFLSLLFTESIPIFYVVKYDKNIQLPSDVKVEFCTTINFASILLFPILYFGGLCFLAIYLNQTFGNIYLTIFFPLFFCITLTYFTTKYHLKRYYFTNKGVQLIDLRNKNNLSFSIDSIEFAGLKKGSRYNESEFYISLKNNRQLKIDGSRISNKEKFKLYFNNANIPYYEYDSFYGETKKL